MRLKPTVRNIFGCLFSMKHPVRYMMKEIIFTILEDSIADSQNRIFCLNRITTSSIFWDYFLLYLFFSRSAQQTRGDSLNILSRPISLLFINDSPRRLIEGTCIPAQRGPLPTDGSFALCIAPLRINYNCQ